MARSPSAALTSSSSVMTSILTAILVSLLFGLLLLFPSTATAASSRPAVAKSSSSQLKSTRGSSSSSSSSAALSSRPEWRAGDAVKGIRTSVAAQDFCPVDYALNLDVAAAGRRFGWGHFWDATRALQKALDFLEIEADRANVDALIGARMAEGQLKALYGHMKENLRSVSSKTLRKAAAVTRKILKKLATVAEKIVGATSLTESEYLSSMLPVIQDDVWNKLDYPSQELSLDADINPSRPINIDRRADTAKEQESDYCLKELVGTADRENGVASGPESGGGPSTSRGGSSIIGQRCKISKQCWVFMTAPKRSGYTLTHEVLYLQVGEMFGCERQMRKLARRTYGKDLNELKQGFCADVFKEVLSEAQQCFPEHLKDLFMEQIALCGIYGFRNFFTEEWLQQIISWQKPSGCFAFRYPDAPSYNFKMLDANIVQTTEPPTTTSTTTTPRPTTTTTRLQRQKTKQKQKVKAATTAKPLQENDFGLASVYNENSNGDQNGTARPMLPPEELAKDLTNFKQMLHYEDMPHPAVPPPPPPAISSNTKFVGLMNGKNRENAFEQFYHAGGLSANGRGTKVIAAQQQAPIFGVKVMTPEDRKAYRESVRVDIDNNNGTEIEQTSGIKSTPARRFYDMRRDRRGQQLEWFDYQQQQVPAIESGAVYWSSSDEQQQSATGNEVANWQQQSNSIINEMLLRELEAAAMLAAENPSFISTRVKRSNVRSISPRWQHQQHRRVKREETLMNNGCMSHATALGIDSLSMHLRYIWEDIYAKNDLMK